MANPISSSIAGSPMPQSLNLAGGLEGLRNKAEKDPKAAVREAAKQFETMFTQQLLKQMRDSTMNADMMDNEGTKMGTEMLDSQWATKMSGMPGGLSDIIAKQLERQMGITQGVTAKPVSANPTPVDPLHADAPISMPQKAAASFIQAHTDAAAAAEKATGIPAKFMIAQAAHETGWGRKEIKNADGSNSFNLFRHQGDAGLEGRDHRHHHHRVHRRQGAQGHADLPRVFELRRVVRRLRQHDEEQPALRRGGGLGAPTPTASPRACRRPATPPIRRTPPSWPR